MDFWKEVAFRFLFGCHEREKLSVGYTTRHVIIREPHDNDATEERQGSIENVRRMEAEDDDSVELTSFFGSY